jgi:thiosulfate dehydrogenase
MYKLGDSMKKYALFLLSFLFIALVLWAFLKKWNGSTSSLSNKFESQQARHQFVIVEANTKFGFDLVDPTQAPSQIRNSVLRGYHLIMNTPLYAPNNVGANIACSNCHFAEGDTIGGKNNGLSLVGVTAIYPKFSKRDGSIISLAERINNCFKRSLNGQPLPEDSREMQDILSYLQWISKEVSSLKKIPWLGISFLKSEHKPNAVAGAQVYKTYCAMCHRDNGEGGPGGKVQNIPPVWGPHSFNDGAGMSTLPMLAAFVYWNMPYQNASLTEEQSLDVAAFILQQPRPHFIEEDG